MTQSKIEKIASIEQEIKQLKERQKQLQQQHNLQERKDRTKRLCRRMGLFESMRPESISLTDEQFKAFLEKTILTDVAHKTLAEIASNPIIPIPSKPAEATQGGGAERGSRTRAAVRGIADNAPVLQPEGRTYIPHECGMCSLADGVLCLSAQKETEGTF